LILIPGKIEISILGI
jgi:hypothetical protein